MKILDDLRRARATAESLERIVADFVRLVPGIASSTDGTWRRILAVEESLVRIEARFAEILRDRRPAIVWGTAAVEARTLGVDAPEGATATVNVAAFPFSVDRQRSEFLYLSKGERGRLRIVPYTRWLSGEVRVEPPFVITEAKVGKNSLMLCEAGAARSVVLPAVEIGLNVDVDVVWPKEDSQWL